MKLLTITLAGALLATPLAAQEAVTYKAEGPMEDITFAVKNAIIGAGLVLDGESHVGEMLARTKEDVGGTKDLFKDAVVYTFCSARISREVMEAELTNVQFCPYAIFVYEPAEAPGEITVGYRGYENTSMKPVTELLDSIVRDALMLD